VAGSSIRSLVQFERGGARGVACLDDSGIARVVAGAPTTLELARSALAEGTTMATAASARAGETLDLGTVALLVPVDHPDPAHLTVSGTG
jgi:hypothetical protein